MNIHWLTILGVALMGVGTLLTFLGQQINNDKSSQQLHDKTVKIEKLSEETIRLNKEITKLSVYNLNYFTGGDSFPFTQPAFNVATPERMDLWLVNGGMFPLYDVSVTIKDITKFKQLVKAKASNKDKKPINLNAFETRINVGGMRPAQIIMDFFSVITPDVGDINYRIEIASRNSYVEQMLHIEFIGEGKYTIEVETKVNGNVVDSKDLFDKISKK